MQYIVQILGVIGDEQWHLKEEFYTLIQATHGKKYPILRKYTNIEKIFKRYLEYGFAIKGKAENLKIKGREFQVKGYSSYKISQKGLLALDYYRALTGGKDLSQGDLFNKYK